MVSDPSSSLSSSIEKVSNFRKLSSLLAHFPSQFANHSILTSNHCLTILDRLPLPYYQQTYRIDFSRNQLSSLHGLQCFNVTSSTSLPTDNNKKNENSIPPNSSSSISTPSTTNNTVVSLDLGYNHISLWSELLYLSSFNSLQHLNLTGNPLCTYAYYRIRILYICKYILRLSSLVSLDGQTITPMEWSMVPIIMQNYQHITQVLLQNECRINQYAMIVRLWTVHKELYQYFYNCSSSSSSSLPSNDATPMNGTTLSNLQKKVGLQPRLGKQITVFSTVSSSSSSVLLPPYPSQRLLNYQIILKSWLLYETMENNAIMKERLLNEIEQKALLYTDDTITVNLMNERNNDQSNTKDNVSSAVGKTTNEDTIKSTPAASYSSRIVQEANQYRQAASVRTEELIDELSYAQKFSKDNISSSIVRPTNKQRNARKCVRSLSPFTDKNRNSNPKTTSSKPVSSRSSTERTPSLPPSYGSSLSHTSLSSSNVVPEPMQIIQPVLRGPNFSTVQNLSSLPTDLQNHIYKWNYAFGALASVQNTVISELNILLLSVQEQVYRILENIWNNSSYQKLYQLEEEISYQSFQFRTDQQNIINDLTNKLHTQKGHKISSHSTGTVNGRKTVSPHRHHHRHTQQYREPTASTAASMVSLLTESSVTGTTRSSITSSKDTSSSDNNSETLLSTQKRTIVPNQLPKGVRKRITRTLPSTEGSQAAVRRLQQKKQYEKEYPLSSKPSDTVLKNEVLIRNENEIARNLSKQVVNELFTNVSKTMQTTTNTTTNTPSLSALISPLTNAQPNILPPRVSLSDQAKTITSSTVKEMLRKSEALLQRIPPRPSTSNESIPTSDDSTLNNVTNPTEKRTVPIEERIAADYSKMERRNSSTNTATTIITSNGSTVSDSDTVSTENDSVMNIATNRVIARILLNNSSTTTNGTSMSGIISDTKNTSTTTTTVTTTPSRPKVVSSSTTNPTTMTLLPVIPSTPPPSAPSPSTFTRKQFTRAPETDTGNIFLPQPMTGRIKPTAELLPTSSSRFSSPSSLIPHPPPTDNAAAPVHTTANSASVASFLPHPPSVSRKIIQPSTAVVPPIPKVPSVLSKETVTIPEQPTNTTISDSTLTPLQTLEKLSSFDLASLVLSLTNRLQEFQAINLQNAQIAADQLTSMSVHNKNLEEHYHQMIQENIRLHQRIQELENNDTYSTDRNNSTTIYPIVTTNSSVDDPSQLTRFRKKTNLETLCKNFTRSRNQKLMYKYYFQWKQALWTEERGYTVKYYVRKQRLRSILRHWQQLALYRIQANHSFEQRIVPQIIHQSLQPFPMYRGPQQEQGEKDDDYEDDEVHTNKVLIPLSSSLSLPVDGEDSMMITTAVSSSSALVTNVQDVSIVPMIEEE